MKQTLVAIAVAMVTAAAVAAFGQVDMTESNYQGPLVNALMIKQWLRPSDTVSACVTSAGDGGLTPVGLTPGKKYVAMGLGDMCLVEGSGPVTTCGAAVAVVPTGMHMTSGIPIDYTAPAITPTQDAGPSDAALIYVKPVSGAGCVEFVPVRP
ncbi:MAG TPA: hypothetical protein DCQ64_06250 [Candidatus Rokubacteria bacterium]|nr:hypothetical protein [Candidatus Rokubacteria bacterium]